MKKLLPLVLAAVLAAPSWAFDAGASLESSTSSVTSFGKAEDGSFTQGVTARGWAQWFLAPQTTVLLKGSLADSLRVSFAKGTPVTNSVTFDLDQLTYSSGTFQIGRADFRDFDGTLLATKLDGAKGQFALKLGSVDLDLKVQAGTSAALFKSGSTVVISQDDLKDRSVDMNLTKPETLWASPRAVAYVEAGLPRLVPSQDFRAAFAGQLDFRSGTAKDGDAQDPKATNAKGAGVSMTYWGLGGSGRLAGPWYWASAAWLGLGSTLTTVGSYLPSTTPVTYPHWKPTLIVNGFASADLTLLQPAWSRTIAGLGVQLGSWDEDGASPDQNKPDGGNPSLYTGWFGISRTGAALVFNPQPGNLALVKGYWSVKPFAASHSLWESLQLVATGLTFGRPSAAAITEGGLKTASKDLYLGSEADLAAQWRPASDWGANLGLGVFVPNTGALDRGVELKALLGLNLSF